MTIEQKFLNKPECVIRFADELFAEEQLDEIRKLKRLAIVEIAGRDSVAAAVAGVEKNGFADLLPIYAYTGTEYGEWEYVTQAVDRLSRLLPEVHIHPLAVMGSPRFWKALNGRYVSELIARFGFYTPCPGCHLYLHAVRIPLAKKLGDVPVISGERQLHSGVVKINQTAEALDFYIDFADHFGIQLLFPLRYISSGEQIEEILQMPWKPSGEQLGCALSKNYQGVDGSIMLASHDILRFFKEFAGPASREIVASYISGKVPDHHAIAGRNLAH